MNKAELIAAVSDDTGLGRGDATKAVESVFNAIAGAVAKSDRVAVPGFGTFEARKRAARTGKNPQTGATLKIAATTVPAFKAASAFKDAVAGKKKAAAAKKPAAKKPAAKKK